MSVNNEASASRQFVASAEAMSTGWIKGTKIWQAVYTVFFVAFVGCAVLAMFRSSRGMHVHTPRYTGLIFMAVLVVAGVVIGGYMFWRSRQKYVLTVNGDTLTIAPRGDIYSLADAQLGIWPNIGVALHLHSGGRRFILGGWDRGVISLVHNGRPHWFQEVLDGGRIHRPGSIFRDRQRGRRPNNPQGELAD